MSDHTEAPKQGLRPPEAEITDRLDYLRDLFERRLKEDRQKKELIGDLKDRLRAAEDGAALDRIAPFVTGTVRVVDRIDAHTAERAHWYRQDAGEPPYLEFMRSVRSELLDLLALHEVTQVDVRGPFDPAVHEVVEMRGESARGGGIRILGLARRGFRHPSRLVRPAQVVAEETAPEAERPPEGGHP
ncbi:nucleotide exchange factor GrpE [Nocardiopsis sp. CNT312]|uniref:nucleotide exchange factor GrpE n=1 Tax=Nocardiopsis sp. CNT312 TaxID=1137268 RepID=UPI000491162B|nr:nucleotide exchange factor GrpE [Nocardiopsis sp. CNT312]